jgi:periplasmic copper chaperone A
MKSRNPWSIFQTAGRAANRAGLLACAMLGVTLATDPALATGGLSLSHPWMRFIIPSRPAAGYFTLLNDTAKSQTLVGASSPACGSLMLHKSVNENGVEKMLMQESIPVPAHGSLVFAPGGYHLMCMSPTKAVAVGHSVPVTLKFGDGMTLIANFPVRGVE